MGKFVKFKDSRNEWRFHLKASNGLKILQSEGYRAESGCENGIQSVKTNSQDPSKFESRKARNGQHYFILKAANGQIVGTSEMYKSMAGLKNGIKSVSLNAKNASVETR